MHRTAIRMNASIIVAMTVINVLLSSCRRNTYCSLQHIQVHAYSYPYSSYSRIIPSRHYHYYQNCIQHGRKRQVNMMRGYNQYLCHYDTIKEQYYHRRPASSLLHLSSSMSTDSSTSNEKNRGNGNGSNGKDNNNNNNGKINNQQKQKLEIKQRQEEYMTKIKDMKGVTLSHTSSKEFVTHFVANQNNTFTIKTAIESILPRSIPNIRSHSNNQARNGRKFVFGTCANDADDKHDDKHDSNHDDKILGNDLNEEIDMSLWTKQLFEYENENIVIQSIEAKFRHDPAFLGRDSHGHTQSVEKEEDQLSPAELIALGSVWFLPSDAPRDPSLGGKPNRVELIDLNKYLDKGDYLRVHHSPKRFPPINNYDWGKYIDTDSNENTKNNTIGGLPGVIVHEDKDAGYIVVNKPPGVPVHPTVDNVLENVAGAVGRSLIRRDSKSVLVAFEKRQHDANERLKFLLSRNVTKISKRKEKVDPLVYVTTPQRLDQNTSGLFVLATKKTFAAYFAKLLRKKTDKELNTENYPSSSNNDIQKKYRCLVCVGSNANRSGGDSTPVSMQDEVGRLASMASDGTIVRHYLEPSIKAPRTFSTTQDDDSTWLECLMRICDVGTAFPVLGSPPSAKLCERLWGHISLKPQECVAVVEVEVELLTGRTHQIRGQLAALGFPLCGDSMYGGSLPVPTTPTDITRKGYADGYRSSEYLSLQCCELSFLDPCHNDQRNKFRLAEAWWSMWLQDYTKSTNGNTSLEATTGALDKSAELKEIQNSGVIDEEDNVINDIKTTIKLSRIQLCPGKHKYVIIRASKQDDAEAEWYVRSASPTECGGLYHADVAKSLVGELMRMGYKTQVMGGGRIDYDDKRNHALVYGFSYGFGKGDHEFVSHLIEKHSKISASFDNSDQLY